MSSKTIIFRIPLKLSGAVKESCNIDNEKTTDLDSPSIYRYVDDHRLCCSFDKLTKCTVLSPQPPLFNCGSLMENIVLRVFMWILGLSALFGNLLTMIWRMYGKGHSKKQSVQNLLVGSLAMSDFLMGIYMIILASADLYYGDTYFIHADSWRSGALCKFAGLICLLSSEASVFFLTFISFDRFLKIVFPFSKVKLNLKSAYVIIVAIWILTFVVSLIPVLTAGPESDWYDLSDVCVGLPLITRPSSFEFEAAGVGDQVSFQLPVAKETKPAWFFSIALFLGVNLICFFVILVCYIAIFVRLKQSSKRVKRSRSSEDDRKVAIKMAVIVGTDFLCWVPVILMGILSQTGAAVIPLEAYIWSVVFLLPVNSSLNPYLYTLASLISSRQNQVDTSTATHETSISVNHPQRNQFRHSSGSSTQQKVDAVTVKDSSM